MENLDLDRDESNKEFDRQFKKDSMPASREVKYKCWGVENEIMYDIAFPSWNGCIEVWKDNKPQSEVDYLSINGPESLGILREYTGRKDSTGQEIYEGDIMESHGEKLIVFYNTHMACFDLQYLVGESLLLVNEDGYVNAHNVIGNIYQDPHLLNN